MLVRRWLSSDSGTNKYIEDILVSGGLEPVVNLWLYYCSVYVNFYIIRINYVFLLSKYLVYYIIFV